MAPAHGSMAMRITYRRRSTHDSKTRCAWHPRCASLGVPPTAQRSGVVGVLIRTLSNSQALTGRHASFPTRRDEACFALSGQSMAPACGSIAMRIRPSRSPLSFKPPPCHRIIRRPRATRVDDRLARPRPTVQPRPPYCEAAWPPSWGRRRREPARHTRLLGRPRRTRHPRRCAIDLGMS